MQTADQLIAEYRATGTLAALPQSHFIDGNLNVSQDGRSMQSFDPG